MKQDLAAVERIDAPDEAIVGTIEEILKEARAGRVTGIAIAVCLTNRQAGSVYTMSNVGNVLILLGEMAILQRRVMDSIRDQFE